MFFFHLSMLFWLTSLPKFIMSVTLLVSFKNFSCRRVVIGFTHLVEHFFIFEFERFRKVLQDEDSVMQKRFERIGVSRTWKSWLHEHAKYFDRSKTHPSSCLVY